MLKFRRRRRPAANAPGAFAEHPDLQIRNLLDDPRLRRAMGLDDTPVAPAPRPERRFDRRRLLDDAAA